MKKQLHVCPVEHAGGLDNKFRKWIQNPQKILKPYLKSDMKVLDFGCGPGFFTLEIAKMLDNSGKVIAIDLQSGMLDIVRQKIAGTELENKIALHQCSGHQIGITEKVDLVLAFYVVHELPDYENFFKEINSILNTGGRILVVEPKFHVSKKSFQDMERVIEKQGLKTIGKPKVLMSRAILCELD